MKSRAVFRVSGRMMIAVRAFLCCGLLLLVSGCIALRKDVEVAKAQCIAESAAKRKVLEESLRAELAKVNERLDAIEKTLALEKKAQENRVNLSFQTLDELRATLREMSSRIDALDVGAGKAAAGLAPAVQRLETQLAALAQEVASLKAELEGLRPVDHVTINGAGRVRLPNDPEKAFAELSKMSTDAAIAQQVREGWDQYQRLFPGRHECEVIYFVGETYFAEKAWNSAIEQYRRIDAEFKDKGCPKHEASYIKIVWALIHLGKKEHAKKVVEGMRDIFPQSEYAKQRAELEKMLGVKPPAPASPDKKSPAPKEQKSPKSPPPAEEKGKKK